MLSSSFIDLHKAQQREQVKEIGRLEKIRKTEKTDHCLSVRNNNHLKFSCLDFLFMKSFRLVRFFILNKWHSLKVIDTEKLFILKTNKFSASKSIILRKHCTVYFESIIQMQNLMPKSCHCEEKNSWIKKCFDCLFFLLSYKGFV